MITSSQMRILSVLVDFPDRDYNLSEIGVLIGKKPGVFQKGINALEREGLVLSRKRGNQRLFNINAAHPLLKEIKALIAKTVGAEALIKSLVCGIEHITTALIYGSYAKDSMRTGSDIDLLVIVDDRNAEDALVKGLSAVEEKLQREVNYKLYSVKDFERRRKEKDPFLAEVFKDNYILLKGNV